MEYSPAAKRLFDMLRHKQGLHTHSSEVTANGRQFSGPDASVSISTGKYASLGKSDGHDHLERIDFALCFRNVMLVLVK
jgi:hypothetical protein